VELCPQLKDEAYLNAMNGSKYLEQGRTHAGNNKKKKDTDCFSHVVFLRMFK